MVTIENQADVVRLVHTFIACQPKSVSLGKHLYTYTMLAFCPEQVRTPWAAEILKRYNYCRAWNVPPYSGDFDSQPPFWVETIRYVENEINALRACDCKGCKGGN